MFLPILIGFGLKVKTRPTVEMSKRIGGSIFVLAIFVTGLALAGLYNLYFVYGSVVLAIIGRFCIQMVHLFQEKNHAPLFLQINNGVRVLDVFPDSPAEKLGVRTGTFLKSVNGVDVHSKKDIYEALQMNPTYCKMVILDENLIQKELQTPIYENDHHELGIIVTE
jgi:hypothetical protein